MTVYRGKVVSFASGPWTASIRLDGSAAQTIENVPVVSHIAATDMDVGNKCIVDTGDHNHPADFVVIAAWPGPPDPHGTHLALTANTPAAVGTAGAVGVGTAAAKDDHVHAHEATHLLHDTAWAAKGDIAAASGNDTATVLTVGANNTVLTADSAQANGVKWAAGATGMNKVTGSGYGVMPAAASGIDPVNSGAGWTNGAWSQVLAATAEADSIIGIIYGWDTLLNTTRVEAEIEIGTGGAGSEVAVGYIPAFKQQGSGGGASNSSGESIDERPIFLPAPIEVASGIRVAVRLRSSSTTLEPMDIRLIYAKASELVAR